MNIHISSKRQFSSWWDGGGGKRGCNNTLQARHPPPPPFSSFLLQRLVSSTVMRGKTKRVSSGTPRGRDYPIRSATMRACKYNTSTKKLPTRGETQWERMHGSFVIHHVFLLIPLGVSVVALYSTQRPSLEQSRLSRYSLWLNGFQLKCFLNYAYRRYRQKKNMFRYFFTELKKIDHLPYSFFKHDAIDIANPSSM